MHHRGILITLGGLVALATLAIGVGLVTEPPRQQPDPPLDPASVPAGLPRRVAELLRREAGAAASAVEAYQSPIYVALRGNGLRLADGWFSGPGWQRPLLDGVARLAREQPAAAERTDSLEVCIPYDYKRLSFPRKGSVIGNVHRGVWGLALDDGTTRERHCPTELLATNRSFERVESLYREARGWDEARYHDAITPYRFRAQQLLLRLDRQPGLIEMQRGNTLVRFEDVNSASTHALADGLGAWMLRQLQPDGRMIYLWWPSRGEESTENNMIRQFMASVCLVRMATARGDASIEAAALSNLRYNFRKFFVRQGEHGLIYYDGTAKLGAMALAALAIVEAPFRAQLAEYEQPLLRTVEAMQRPDGSFRTFFGSERDDNQNFYPGEALLLWSVLYDQHPEPALLERFMRAFRHYRGWHLDPHNRNPAFVPWHTQAYVKVWQHTHDAELEDFVFEMNDWLLGVQQWEGLEYADLQGRFYAPDRPFGPPHASSTAVYLEGLIDAWQLARAVGDQARADRYRLAILRGLRSLMQLQFRDDVDMYYVSDRNRVEGGLRTTEYDNGIRVDNVQHALMGIQRILQRFDREQVW
jgi:hypothetical protein